LNQVFKVFFFYNIASYCEKIQEQAVKKLKVFRHSKAPSIPGRPDSERILSQEGITLAKDRRTSLGSFRPDLVITSPFIRAVDTAIIVTGFPDETIVRCPELIYDSDSEMGQALDRMYEELGNVPLERYWEHAEAGALASWANMAGTSLRQILSEHGDPENVAVFGHGILSNAMLEAYLYHLRNHEYVIQDDFAELIGKPLKECEGFDIAITGNMVGVSLIE